MKAISFPIYDEMRKLADDETREFGDVDAELLKITELLIKEEPEISKHISTLIYAVMYHHEIVTSYGKCFKKVPYKGTVHGSTSESKMVGFRSQDIPILLKKIIVVLLHNIMEIE